VHSELSAERPYPIQRSPLRKTLAVMGILLPGDFLKTLFYLNAVERPRRMLRLALHTFYRIDHVYAVLREVKQRYRGSFSILEFGTSDGYAFTKMLYATRYLGMEDRVTVHAFDSFEGMPAPHGAGDRDLVTDNPFVEGEFRGRYADLAAYCAARYRNFRIHVGDFADSIDAAFLSSLESQPPVLVWIDCDYYSSARVVFERLLHHLPNGCVVYFDEYEQVNFGSRFTGEARLVHEINGGEFGDDVELVLDTRLSLDTQRIYRFIRREPNAKYELLEDQKDHFASAVHHRTNDSPLP
jgi:hypothetical protein